MKNLFWLLGAVFLLASCVANKKYVYLQNKDVNKGDLPKDSVVREYRLVDFDYKIQPEDIVSIRFESLTPKEYDFFSRETPLSGQIVSQQANPLLIGELVDGNGAIQFPVIGKVKIAGLNVFEAQDTLQKIANQYLESAVVKVRLVNFRVTILGEVNREGTIVLSNNRVTLMEAIGLAGGLTDLADKKNVKLIRQSNGASEVIYLDLLDESLIRSPHYFVHQNDLLIVPALRQRPFRRYFGQNLGVVVSTLSLVLLTINLTR
jgi:polysaccharide export outer membrane protein